MNIPNNRTTLINYLIQKHNYISYLEVGLKHFECNFTYIKCPIKMSVDPNPEHENVTYKMTSDKAFQYMNPNTFDIIFIDGLHQEQQVDRDIENSLKVLKQDGIIVLHDCNPCLECNSLEYPSPGIPEWNGSVYKSMIKFHQLNPECSFTIDFDYGCGIIYPKLAQSPIRLNKEPLDISWNTFKTNRESLLGLKNIKVCLDTLN